jgi:hypothetical protein
MHGRARRRRDAASSSIDVASIASAVAHDVHRRAHRARATQTDNGAAVRGGLRTFSRVMNAVSLGSYVEITRDVDALDLDGNIVTL